MMLNFLVDVRDYIYIQANYKANSLVYWVLTVAAISAINVGVFMLFAIIMPDALFLYFARHKYYSPGIQYFNYLIITILGVIFAIGFNKITSKFPLPEKEEITPKVFRRKLLRMYFFLFTGFVFMILCIFVFVSLRFR